MGFLQRLVIRARWFHWFPGYQRRVAVKVLTAEVIVVVLAAVWWWLFW